MKINELNKREKIAMVQSRMNNYQRKYYELYLDLVVQEAIQGKEQHIKLTKDRMDALKVSYAILEKEIEMLEGDNNGE